MSNSTGEQDQNTNRAATDTLFRKSIAIINRGLGDNVDITGAGQVGDMHHRMPGQSPALTDHLPTGRHFAVAVFESDPASPEGVYDVCFNGDALECASLNEETHPRVACRVVKSDVEKVCEEPGTYIDKPMECALVWMMTRMAA